MPNRLRRPDRQLSNDLLAQAADTTAPTPDAWRLPRPEGWTLPDMRHAAAIGSSRIRAATSRLLGDALNIAWEGVALAVALNPQVSWADASAAAARAVADEASEIQHIHRLARSDAHTGARAAVYWCDWLDNQPAPPTAVLERIALAEVWDALTDDQRELLALAAIMPSGEVADLLGISPSRVSQRLTAARRAAIALWHDWEPPPSKLPRARVPNDEPPTCPQGHELIATRQRGSGWTHRRCRTCDAARYHERTAS